MRAVEQRVYRHLERLRKDWTAVPGLLYRGPADFVIQEGQWFPPAPEDGTYPKGALRHCFNNALTAGLVRGLPYVEGYASAGRWAPIVEHAWVLDPDGRAVELTWPADHPDLPVELRVYIGVRFSIRRADECSWDGDATIIDDHKRGWPLLRAPWRPEASPGDTDGLLDAIARRYVEHYPGDRHSATDIADGLRQFWTTGEPPFAQPKGDAA